MIPIFNELFLALQEFDRQIDLKAKEWQEVGGMKFLLTQIEPLLNSRRELINRGCNLDKSFLAYVKARAKEDLYFFVSLTLAFDPRLTELGHHSNEIPVLLMPRQKEYLTWVKYSQKDPGTGVLLVKKNRDQGATILFCSYLAWRLLHVPNDLMLVSSLKLQSVHTKGVAGTLMERIKFVLSTLPAALRGDTELFYCRLLNRSNGSAIEGQSSEQAGRSSRYSCILLDEASEVRNLENSLSAMKSASPAVFLLSTPGKPFDLFHSLFLNLPEDQKFEFKAQDDLRKVKNGSIQEHLEENRKVLPKHIFYSQIMGDFYASSERPFLESKIIETIIKPGLPIGFKIAGLDLASAAKGSDRSVLTIRQGSQIVGLWIWEEEETITVCEEAIKKAEEIGCHFFYFDGQGIGAGIGKVFKQHCKIPYKGICGSNRSPDPGLGRNMRDYLFNQLETHLYNAYLKETSELEVSHRECLYLINQEDLLKQLRSLELDDNMKVRYTANGSPDLIDSLRLTFVPKSVFPED